MKKCQEKILESHRSFVEEAEESKWLTYHPVVIYWKTLFFRDIVKLEFRFPSASLSYGRPQSTETERTRNTPTTFPWLGPPILILQTPHSYL